MTVSDCIRIISMRSTNLEGILSTVLSVVSIELGVRGFEVSGGRNTKRAPAGPLVVPRARDQPKQAAALLHPETRKCDDLITG